MKISNFKFIIFKISAAVVATVFLLPLSIEAAGLFVENRPAAMGLGSEFIATVYMDTDGEFINAIEGEIIIPEILELVEIRDGNSIINFWVERPNLREKAIYFSGITPGGFNLQHGLIFDIVFRGVAEGSGRLISQNVRAYKNDGLGTHAQVTLTHGEFTISQSAPEHMVSPLYDKVPPENFRVHLARDPGIFDGKWFITFQTQDKASGMDYYEVKEGRGEWVVATSPYELKNQNLRDDIRVRAVDRAGNAQISKLRAANPPWYKKYANFGIIILTLIVLYLVDKYRKRNKLFSK